MIVRLLIAALFINFIHTPGKEIRPAESLMKITKAVSKSASDDIWPGFDATEFTSLEEGSLLFSPEPGNPESQIFMRLSDEYFREHSLEENIAITFHEAFHGFQRSPVRKGGKWGAENAFLVFEYEVSSPRNNALFAIESKLLKEALEAGSGEEMKSSVAGFLSVRQMRQAELQGKFAEFEKGAELNEGLAEYAGTIAVVEAFRVGAEKGSGFTFANSDSREFLRRKYSSLDSINRIGSNVRRKFYLTGSAQGILLDKLMPGTWKNRVQFDGSNLQDLIAETTEPKDVDLSSLGYEEILRSETEEAAKRNRANRELLAGTLAGNGTKLTVDYSGLGGSVYIQRFDPMNVTMVEPDVRVHTRMVRFGLEGSFSAAFDRSVVEDLKRRVYEAVLPGEVKIVVDGVALDPGTNGEFTITDGLNLQSDGVSVTADRGKVVIANGVIKIVL